MWWNKMIPTPLPSHRIPPLNKSPFLPVLILILLQTWCDNGFFASAFSSPNPNNNNNNNNNWKTNMLERLEGVADRVDGLNPFLDEKVSIPDEPKGKLDDIESSTEPRRFFIESSQTWDVLSASLPFVLRLAGGIFGEGYDLSVEPIDDSVYTFATFGDYQLKETCSVRKPRLPLEIYEFEACPFCRKVREAVSILSLDVIYKPCPRNGRLHRRAVEAQYGGNARYPYMVDPNSGVRMFDSDEIVSYLFRLYGNGNVPPLLGSGGFATLTSFLSLLPRYARGATRSNSDPPSQRLVLWSEEGSPFCKLVREVLCELEIEHKQISCPRGSPNRQIMFEKTGTFQVPYLEDPNEGVALFESLAIKEYLEKRYGVRDSPVKYI